MDVARVLTAIVAEFERQADPGGNQRHICMGRPTHAYLEGRWDLEKVAVAAVSAMRHTEPRKSVVVEEA